MKRTALLMLAALIGCDDKKAVTKVVTTAGQPCVDADQATWSIEAARYATNKSDYRVFGYAEQGEGAAVLVPGPDEIKQRFYGPGDPRVREIVIERDISPREPCVDCDAPLSPCGERQRELMARYNTEICRQASLNGVSHCGQAQDDKGRWLQPQKKISPARI